MSEYIAKASIEPRDYRVVFLIQKETSHICDASISSHGIVAGTGFEPATLRV